MTDLQIVRLIKKRDEQGIKLLLECYGGLLKSIITRQLFQLSRYTDECMNDTLLGIWQYIDAFDESKGSFKNWIAVIARYQAIDYLRKYKKEITTEELIEQGYKDNELELWESQWHDLIKDLSTEDQYLITMIYKNGYKPEEVAQITGMKKDNIYNRLSRSRKKLKQLYGGQRQ